MAHITAESKEPLTWLNYVTVSSAGVSNLVTTTITYAYAYDAVGNRLWYTENGTFMLSPFLHPFDRAANVAYY